MRSVCVVCTRARALITDRDRRHRHAVLCTLLLLRRLRTQHPPRCRRCLRSRGFAPSPPLLLALEAPPWPLAAVAACARARGFSIAAVAACARGSSLAAVGPFLSLFSHVFVAFSALRGAAAATLSLLSLALLLLLLLFFFLILFLLLGHRFQPSYILYRLYSVLLRLSYDELE